VKVIHACTELIGAEKISLDCSTESRRKNSGHCEVPFGTVAFIEQYHGANVIAMKFSSQSANEKTFMEAINKFNSRWP
jgi:hypothetical protein